jgi:hypothetical protein
VARYEIELQNAQRTFEIRGLNISETESTEESPAEQKRSCTALSAHREAHDSVLS